VYQCGISGRKGWRGTEKIVLHASFDKINEQIAACAAHLLLFRHSHGGTVVAADSLRRLAVCGWSLHTSRRPPRGHR
jgi:hypothetical protein